MNQLTPVSYFPYPNKKGLCLLSNKKESSAGSAIIWDHIYETFSMWLQVYFNLFSGQCKVLSKITNLCF